MNRELDPINFGWELSEEKYRPIKVQEQLCPRELLERLWCNCKTDCSTRMCRFKQVRSDNAYIRDRYVIGRYHQGRRENFRAPGLDSAPGPTGGARTRQGPLQLMNRASDKSNTDKSGPRQIKY